MESNFNINDYIGSYAPIKQYCSWAPRNQKKKKSKIKSKIKNKKSDFDIFSDPHNNIFHTNVQNFRIPQHFKSMPPHSWSTKPS